MREPDSKVPKRPDDNPALKYPELRPYVSMTKIEDLVHVADTGIPNKIPKRKRSLSFFRIYRLQNPRNGQHKDPYPKY